jgi:fatty-acyl-CoA synthase
VRSTAEIESCRRELREQFPQWQPQSLAGWLDECAVRYRTRPFVITDPVTLTYDDVAEQSRRISAGLVALGVSPGDRVGMVMANYPEFVAVKFAIARCGAIAVPFNYLYRAVELGFVLADSGCKVLVTMTGFGTLDYQSMLDDIVPQWDCPGFADRAPDVVPQLRHVVLLDTDGRARPGVRRVEELAASSEPAPTATISPDAPGDMLYTSGTTGSPKGVLVSHDSVLRTAYASALTRGFQDGRRILFSLPCYHMFGYVEGVLSAMFVGGAIVPLPSFSVVGYFAGVEQHHVTDILCVPTMAVAMVQSPARHAYDLSSLEAILCGSAPAPIWLWQEISQEFGVNEIVTGYGMTECGGAMTLTLPEDPLHLTSETVGRPKLAGAAGIAGMDALVDYAEVHGELVSSGPTTMIGYWNRPAETAAALREGLLFSGDLGRVRADGYLEVTGRSKELYKSGGELVMPKEIEELLAGHKDISQVFAIGLVDEHWGEIGCVVVVPAPGAWLTEEDVLSLCRANLARFKVPKRVVFYDAADLPTTPTGKVQKFKLVEALGVTR